MKIALLGSTGMLGSVMAEVLKAGGHELLVPLRNEVDLNRPHSFEKFFKDRSFDILVNCAGFTRVDECEEPAKFSMALNVNGTSPGWLAKFCKKTDRMLVHFSTDYVFDGLKEEPYLETDKPAPLNTYGRTKWQGEKLIRMEGCRSYIIRTSWIFGSMGNNFVKTIAGLLKTKRKIEVVKDQVGGPTYTQDLALFTRELLDKKVPMGTYHFCNEGYTSWYGFAREIQEQLGLTACEIAPVLSENVFRPAQRPSNSRLDLSKAIQTVGQGPRSWKEALKEYLSKEYKSEAS